jgi:hypothetical protein
MKSEHKLKNKRLAYLKIVKTEAIKAPNKLKSNEAPRSKLRGIRAELRRSLTRLRSNELRRGSPCLRCRGVAEGEDRSSPQQAAGY